MISRPLLAATADDDILDNKIQYPVLASEKLDGIRVLIHPELGPVTRKFKRVPNEFLYDELNHPEFYGLDGEILTYADDEVLKPDSFNTVQSKVMSRSGTTTYMFWVFDCFREDVIDHGFARRLLEAANIADKHYGIVDLPHESCRTAEELREFAQQAVAGGAEGIVFRDVSGKYKEGRSTVKEQIMVKYKQFKDAEGTIIGFEELMRNRNEQTRDVFGLAERSSHKANLESAGTLGALIVQTEWGTLRIGTGFDVGQRNRLWDARNEYLGRVVTFKYQTFGMQDLPRFPVFKGFRPEVE